MQSFVTWSEDHINEKSVLYFAYINASGLIILSKNICIDNKPIKFVNHEVRCLQLIVCYENRSNTLHACFENGIVESIHTGPTGLVRLNSLSLIDNIIKIEDCDCCVCMLSSAGEILVENKIIFDDPNIMDIQGSENSLLLFYRDSTIELYDIENYEDRKSVV